MSAIMFGFSFSLFTALVVIVGDIVIKVAADGAMPLTSRYVLAGCALYGISAILWYFTMRYVTLAQGGVAFSMLNLLALCALGALYFDEPVRMREAAGIGCALLSMFLMIRVA